MIANPIPWPGGARCAVAITWDLDADSGLNYYNRERADTLVASQTMTRYGPMVVVPRLVALLRELGHRQTVFVPGWCIERYPEACKLLADNDHELALHGYLHERPNELSAEDERYWLKRALSAFENLAGHRPTGWRAPSFAFSKYSLDYLVEEGFRYDSSLMGDDIPYRIESALGSLIELPTEWTNDDWVYYMFSRDFGTTMPIHEPSRVIDVFRAQFEACWKYGGLWISVWHPFLSGRLARLDAIAGFIDHMIAKGGVWFATLDEIAAHVEALEAAGTWSPRRERLPAYESPLPEFAERG